MYAGCSDIGCEKRAKYLVDIEYDNKTETHTRCEEHVESGFGEKDIMCKVDIHDIVLPLSEGGQDTEFRSSCDYCTEKVSNIEMIRFEDGFGVVSTEARCKNCADDIEKSRDLLTRKNIRELSIRAEDCR